MSKRSFIRSIGILVVFSVMIFAGIKYQAHLLEQELAENVQNVQNALNAHWATIEITNNDVIISGQTDDNNVHSELISQLTKIKGINSVTSNVKIVKLFSTNECQQQIDTLLTYNEIRFSAENSNIDSASYDLLEEIANSLNNCPDGNLIIISHTSNDDTLEKSLKVSENRSTTILDLFHDFDLGDRKVTALAMGPAFPIAPNDSPENRDINDRIEFRIQ